MVYTLSPASRLEISPALIQAALDNMSEDDGLPPHPPSPTNNAGTTHNVAMMSNDDEDLPCNPYPYSLPPDLSDSLADTLPKKRVRQKKVYQPEDFEDMDDAWFE
ncbi:hypothetical protein CVT25_014354 [Psilocybe cyanescens]|uniref:Uncharacterized protein n=1 Tax=Psilocybe cyanescens TaxID=93625 RepID=A0A409WUF5_PSICY|nr:hypothetical protein CVT25_014354 [Psilocybe cyanescens]